MPSIGQIFDTSPPELQGLHIEEVDLRIFRLILFIRLHVFLEITQWPEDVVVISVEFLSEPSKIIENCQKIGHERH